MEISYRCLVSVRVHHPVLCMLTGPAGGRTDRGIGRRALSKSYKYATSSPAHSRYRGAERFRCSYQLQDGINGYPVSDKAAHEH